MGIKPHKSSKQKYAAPLPSSLFCVIAGKFPRLELLCRLADSLQGAEGEEVERRVQEALQEGSIKGQEVCSMCRICVNSCSLN